MFWRTQKEQLARWQRLALGQSELLALSEEELLESLVWLLGKVELLEQRWRRIRLELKVVGPDVKKPFEL